MAAAPLYEYFLVYLLSLPDRPHHLKDLDFPSKPRAVAARGLRFQVILRVP